jgi:hypothetical protein
MEFGFRPGDPTGPTDRDDLRLIVEVERWRDGADDDAVAVLDGVMGKCLPIRPLLDALGWRALPHLDVEAACAWHRDRVLLFTADTCAQLLDEGYSRERYDGVAERFCEIARPLARELLVALGTDVARGEAAGARVVAEADDPIAALRAGALGTLALITVLLGDGTTTTARQRRWSHPIVVSHGEAVAEAELIGPEPTQRLARAHQAAAEELLEVGPSDRCRWLLKRFQRSPWSRARVGTGFADDELLADLFENTITGSRPRMSRAHKRVYDAYLRGLGPRDDYPGERNDRPA